MSEQLHICPECGSMLHLVIYDDDGDGSAREFICAECFLSKTLGRAIPEVPESRVMRIGSKHLKKHAEAYLGITRAAHREAPEEDEDEDGR